MESEEDESLDFGLDMSGVSGLELSGETEGEASEKATTTEEQELQEVELVKKTKSKSVVWTLFGFKADSRGQPIDENKPICQLCQQTIAVKGGNTSNLFSHLKHHHPKKYSKLKAGST